MRARLRAHTRDMAFLQEDVRDGHLELDADAELVQPVHHRIDDILRLVADGKDAVAALDLDGHALLGKEVHDIPVVEGAHRAVEEGAVAVDVPDDLGDVGRIRDVAAPLARDHHLAAGPLHLLEQRDFRAVLGRADGGHHAGRAGSYD